MICTIRTKTENKCTDLFHKYHKRGNFLSGNGSYVYKESDMSQDELYLKKHMTTFIKELSHVGDVIPQNEILKKRLKRLVETRLLMDAHTKEERKSFFIRSQ